ncbi:SDR family NAD(P)-dependent oxidoreductase [Novosphingobium sp. PY1]|uniref:SDR family NAD(P)-dependent oxidoreductase n=1 Tax=Novosphingobium sp. PY1 TaxID=1882221 RepID=UPI001A8EAA1E|nr:SDR family oxidoreductase [Novosphingobium sp. PY1]GFM28824.1 short-chain dehydrogenase/reductase SDR [Novosphingobium sp. PY1]
MSGALSGQTALVTGATGAIARASAIALARDGAHLVLMARRPEGLEQARAEIAAAVPGTHIALEVGDCIDSEAVARACKAAWVIAERLDIVFATVGGGSFAPILDVTPEALRKDFELNVISAHHALRHAVPLMPDGGSLVFLSSGAAPLTFPGLSSYSVSKAGLEALVRSAADELGWRGIRVNAVRPGLTRSDSTGSMFDAPETLEKFLPEYPLGRLGEAEDMAGAVRYLAGPESAWVTGQCIAVDGGNLLRRSPNLGIASPSKSGVHQS